MAVPLSTRPVAPRTARRSCRGRSRTTVRSWPRRSARASRCRTCSGSARRRPARARATGAARSSYAGPGGAFGHQPGQLAAHVRTLREPGQRLGPGREVLRGDPGLAQVIEDEQHVRALVDQVDDLAELVLAHTQVHRQAVPGQQPDAGDQGRSVTKPGGSSCSRRRTPETRGAVRTRRSSSGSQAVPRSSGACATTASRSAPDRASRGPTRPPRRSDRAAVRLHEHLSRRPGTGSEASSETRSSGRKSAAGRGSLRSATRSRAAAGPRSARGCPPGQAASCRSPRRGDRHDAAPEPVNDSLEVGRRCPWSPSRCRCRCSARRPCR